MQARILRTDHKDLIHDLAYDYYGKRIATCSSDLCIKVFDHVDETDSWEENDCWKAADATILKVIWAHPEHGQVIATASVDRTVRIFEEQDHAPKNSGKRWIEKARLADSRAAVQDIWFAPEHLGLRLASISADTYLRIYEALEPNNISHWTLMDEIMVLPQAPSRDKETSFCLTWCPSRWHGQQVAIAAMDTVRIWRADRNGKWQAAEALEGHRDLVRDISWGRSMGKSYQLIATACKDGHVRIFKLTEGARQPKADSNVPDAEGKVVAQRRSDDDDDDDEDDDDDYQDDADGETGAPYAVELIADFDDHMSQVWRVSFNITGTILSSAGDDGLIRLWKSSYAHKYQCMSIVSMEKAAGGDDDEMES